LGLAATPLATLLAGGSCGCLGGGFCGG
jgi:hypothetical protein